MHRSRPYLTLLSVLGKKMMVVFIFIFLLLRYLLLKGFFFCVAMIDYLDTNKQRRIYFGFPFQRVHHGNEDTAPHAGWSQSVHTQEERGKSIGAGCATSGLTTGDAFPPDRPHHFCALFLALFIAYLRCMGAFLRVCLHAMCVPGAHRCQKKTSDPLELHG